jgi:HEAT repeat protein
LYGRLAATPRGDVLPNEGEWFMKKALIIATLLVTATVIIAVTVVAQDAPFQGAVTSISDVPATPLLTLAREQVAKKGGDAWIGWQIDVRPSMRHATIRYMAGKNGHSMMNIDDRDGDSGIERIGSERRNLLLRFRNGQAAPQEALLLESDPALKFTVPLVWIKGVSGARSFAAVKTLAEQGSRDGERGFTLALVAAHAGEEPVKYFLGAVRGSGATEFRKNALFWYAHTLENGNLGELPKLEGELKEKELRKQIAFAYHTVGGAAAVGRLQVLALSDDQELAEQSIFWIGQCDDIDVMPILEKLYTGLKSAKLKEKVLFAAHNVDDARAGDFLLKIARNENDPELQGKAVFWLSQRDDEKALPLLKDLYRTLKTAKVREQVLFAVSQIDSAEALVFLSSVAMNDPSTELRSKATFWIGQHDDEAKALEMLDRIYTAPNQDRGTREKVLFSISQIDDLKSVDYLEKAALGDPDRDLRDKAIFWLGQCDDETTALKKLSGIYGRLAEHSLRERTIFAISQIESAEASKFLLSLVRNEKDPELRKKALFWLSQRDDDFAAKLVGDLINP